MPTTSLKSMAEVLLQLSPGAINGGRPGLFFHTKAVELAEAVLHAVAAWQKGDSNLAELEFVLGVVERVDAPPDDPRRWFVLDGNLNIFAEEGAAPREGWPTAWAALAALFRGKERFTQWNARIAWQMPGMRNYVIEYVVLPDGDVYVERH